MKINRVTRTISWCLFQLSVMQIVINHVFKNSRINYSMVSMLYTSRLKRRFYGTSLQLRPCLIQVGIEIVLNMFQLDLGSCICEISVDRYRNVCSCKERRPFDTLEIYLKIPLKAKNKKQTKTPSQLHFICILSVSLVEKSVHSG